MDVIFEVSAGLDIHRDTVVASVRKRRGKRETVETRTFGTFHVELKAMCSWLAEEGVQAVGMESTGVYFKPVLKALQTHASGRALWLVNAAAVKQVPGRKTDVNDSAWLSKLVMHGLVRPSFVPDEAQEDLRLLTRYRSKRVGELRSCKNRIIKLLEASGIKLASVCSDVLGKSGRAMIQALLEGTRSPEQIAELADHRLRVERSKLVQALEGSLRSGTRWLLRTLMTQLTQVEKDIDTVDAEITLRLTPHEQDVALLLQIPGLERISIATLLAEIGADMSVFDSAKRLASWAGLAPGNHESAGKKMQASSRKGDRWVRTMLVQVAHGAVRSKTARWRTDCARIARNTGNRKKALFAIARKLCVTVFHVLRDRTYRPYLPPAPTPAHQEQTKRRALEQLRALGFHVTLDPIALTAPQEA